MFSDSKIGFLLLLTHFLAAFFVGVVFRFYPFYFRTLKKYQKQKNEFFSQKNESSSDENKEKSLLSTPLPEDKKSIRISELGSIMGEGIRNSVSTLLLICGFLVFFCVLGTILDKTGVSLWVANILQSVFLFLGFSKDFVQEISTGYFKGVLEITSGIKFLSTLQIDIHTILPLVATILGFGGISVHMQVASIISHTDLSLKPYLLGKTLHGIFAGLITYCILNYTNFFQLEAVETFSSITLNEIRGITGSGNLLIITLSALFLLSLFVLLFHKKTALK